MNPTILHQDVQNYILEHLHEDISKIVLRKSPFPGITSKELAEQIESKRSAEKKLPTWYNTPGIYFPPKVSIEQTSSEITADYKSSLIKGETLIDLTGGFGVDSYYFAKKIQNITHCEINPHLSQTAQHNANVLGRTNITFINTNGLDYLKNAPQNFDTIYIDPSRRVNNKKVFLLSDCEPDVVSNLDLLLAKADRIIIKTSPLFDLQSGIRELTNISQIHVISVKNDCKELLWVLDRGFSDQPQIVCTSIGFDIQHLIFSLREEKALQLNAYTLPQDYLYEPDVALLKAGCFKLIAERFGVEKLNVNTHLYTSQQLKKEFIGRKFEVIASQSYTSFIKSNSLKKANIIARNFPLSIAEIKKKHKLQDGGEDYLLFTTGPKDELLVIQAERL